MSDGPDDYFGLTLCERLEPLVMAAILACALLGALGVAPFAGLYQAISLWLHGHGFFTGAHSP
jgi:hypothetical protein